MYITEILKKLALIGAMHKCITISAVGFSQYTSTNSKTTSRLLKQLEEKGYITRQLVTGGQKIKLTNKGINLLQNEYTDYHKIFEKVNNIELEGQVIAGIGEGKYYISQSGYTSQFIDKLGFEPYPGTLNVKLNVTDIMIKQQLNCTKEIPIYGFTNQGRTFGNAKCYLIKLDGITSAIIVPERTHYPPDLLEIIAPVNLRRGLNLNDGDKVKIFVEKNRICGE